MNPHYYNCSSPTPSLGYLVGKDSRSASEESPMRALDRETVNGFNGSHDPLAMHPMLQACLTPEEADLYKLLLNHHAAYQSLCEKLQAQGIAFPGVTPQHDREFDNGELFSLNPGAGSASPNMMSAPRSGENVIRQRIEMTSSHRQSLESPNGKTEFENFLARLHPLERFVCEFFMRSPNRVVSYAELHDALMQMNCNLKAPAGVKNFHDMVMWLKNAFKQYELTWPFVEYHNKLLYIEDDAIRQAFEAGRKVKLIKLDDKHMIDATTLLNDIDNVGDNPFITVCRELFKSAGREMSMEELMARTHLTAKQIDDEIEAAIQNDWCFRKGLYGIGLVAEDVEYDYTGPFRIDENNKLCLQNGSSGSRR